MFFLFVWTLFWKLFKRIKLHNWSNIKCSVPCWQSTSGQEECTFRAKVYGVMGTFSNQPCAADKCQEKAKKVGDWKTRFRNDCYRCSTSVLVFGCWLMSHVIYLQLRQKWLLLQAQQINFFQSKWPGLKKIIILSENSGNFF